MTLEPAHHRVDERDLEIEGGLVAWDPVLTEPLEHCADVLMLVLDRAARPIDHRLKQSVMFSLAVRPPGDIIAKHREIIRHDCVILIGGPVTGHGSSQAERPSWKSPGSCQQLRRHAEHWSGIGEPLVERVHRGAML